MLQKKDEIVIQKFGGTSIGTPKNVKNIIKILNSQKKKQIVVLSAFTKVTDLLFEITFLIKSRQYEDSLKLLSRLYNIHSNWAKELAESQYVLDKLNAQIDQILEQIRTIIQGIQIIDEMSENVEKRIIAFGEILSSSLFFILVADSNKDTVFLNAVEVVVKDDDVININSETIFECLEENEVVITQGFICLEKGKISNLGRGGSDYTAALIGAELNAYSINIWTDVDGILTASPKIIEDAKCLDFISFNQVRALAKYGAKVVHPDTILPAMKKNIEVRVLNTSNPDFAGTKISNLQQTKKFSISMIQNVSFIEVKRNEDSEYFSNIVKVLKNISINKFTILEVISNIDNTLIYYSKDNEKSSKSIICIINPDINLIANILKQQDYIYIATDKTLKIFIDTDISEKLLNLIYQKLKTTLKL